MSVTDVTRHRPLPHLTMAGAYVRLYPQDPRARP
jgi:hypothetical protein